MRRVLIYGIMKKIGVWGESLKVCEKCGACNSDQKRVCADCGENLGERLTAVQEAEFRKNTRAKIEKMSNKRDPLYVSIFDKIFGTIGIIGTATTLAFIVKNLIVGHSCELVFFGLVGFALAVFEAFFPKISWMFEKMRLTWYVDDADNAEPGVLYFVTRRITLVFFVIFGAAAFVTSFF